MGLRKDSIRQQPTYGTVFGPAAGPRTTDIQRGSSHCLVGTSGSWCDTGHILSSDKPTHTIRRHVCTISAEIIGPDTHPSSSPHAAASPCAVPHTSMGAMVVQNSECVYRPPRISHRPVVTTANIAPTLAQTSLAPAGGRVGGGRLGANTIVYIHQEPARPAHI